MTQSKSKSVLIISLITLIATCISGVLLINEKNVQLALTLMILPIALSSYLYPRYIYLVFLFIINILSVYLPGLMGIQFNVSAAELIVFNVVCISFSELIQQLKQSYSKANEKLSQLNFLHHNIVNKIKEGVTILKNDQAFFANDQISNLTGLSPEEIKSFSFLNLAHPEEKYKLSSISTSNSDSGDHSQNVRFWIKNKNGEDRYIENLYWYLQPQADESFEFIFTNDLTNQKKTEEILARNQKSLTRIISNLPGMAYRCKNDANRTMEFVSEGAKDLTGYLPDALINNERVAYQDLIHPKDRLAAQSKIEEMINTNSIFRLTYRINTADQKTKWVWEQGKIVQNIDTPSEKILEGFITDITDHVLSNQELSQSEQQYRALANSITDVFMALDNSLRFTYWNQACEKLIGVSSKDTIGKSVHTIFQDPQGIALSNALQEAMDHKKPRRFIQKLKINGEEPFLEINIYPSSYGVAVFGRDVTERIEAENQLKYLSTHDALTEIYSRTYFETEMSRLQHSRLFPISIVMADLDGLKYVNDNQGHSAGDELLRQTAKLLRESFRNEDVVARIGGDEFGILIANTGMDAVHKAIKRVQSKIREYNKSHPGLKIKLSIGVATSQIGESLEETAKRADKKMYEDKSTHKGDTRELKPY